ncbi:ATP synthase F0 subunit B [Streptomyces sp. VRA16 Mangrove soil]|uniref:ATP synthase F0 subunit B n=1 Tax=Streptomyces sp. VRA16 Mangrove soil TaxID=2817434 RepID=UPI001A9E9B1C|nr:cell division initiation protein [Streptomyces sp. VRA16 Mangrove soil]MBO1335908.1 cell division initiation protein [Streptomyces sp. VRA16 Mangrove soil]
MDVQKKLDEIVAAVGNARSMPMSASCVVNRADLLSMLEEVRQALPGSLAQAQELIGGREQMVEQARAEAERIIETAHAERGTLISDTEIARRSQNEADRILAEARQEAEEVRAEADDYVDSKLANFEVVLTKTLGSVGRGREKLLGTGPGVDEQGYVDPELDDAPERSHDPETLRRDADAYVDTKLGAFEAVLAKTLEAVGKGRQKLHGRIASDDLGLLPGADGEPQAHTSDADYLAGLAEIGSQDAQAHQAASQEPEAPQIPQIPAQQPVYAQEAPQHDPYAAYQQPYGQQDPYAAQQQDPYAAYQQQDPYAAQQQDPYAAQQQAAYGYGYPQDPQQPQAAAPAGALDETSLFDTSMISMDQVRDYERQYDQGR